MVHLPRGNIYCKSRIITMTTASESQACGYVVATASCHPFSDSPGRPQVGNTLVFIVHRADHERPSIGIYGPGDGVLAWK